MGPPLEIIITIQDRSILAASPKASVNMGYFDITFQFSDFLS